MKTESPKWLRQLSKRYEKPYHTNLGAPKLDKSQLIDILENPPPVARPVIMPDFFIDHFIVSTTLQELVSNLEKLAEQGGGNITGTNQFIQRGGNSVNTASALLELGVNPHLIIKTDDYGATLLKSLVSSSLDLSHVHSNGSLSLTASF